jgi:hypothetical protein
MSTADCIYAMRKLVTWVLDTGGATQHTGQYPNMPIHGFMHHRRVNDERHRNKRQQVSIVDVVVIDCSH